MARSSSRGPVPHSAPVLSWDEVWSLVRSSQPHSAGCICGAAPELEDERIRLEAVCRAAAERWSALTLREADLEKRGLRIEEHREQLWQGEAGLAERRAGTQSRLRELEELRKEVAGREAIVRRGEVELRRHVMSLETLEREVASGEETVAQEELNLIEERNRRDEKLHLIQAQRTDFNRQAQNDQDELREVEQQFAALTEEQELLQGDEQLLLQIQEQIAPTRRSLAERESRLSSDEMDVLMRLADCEEKEAHLVPEHQRTLEALRANEGRARELQAREDESEGQRLRLLRRQRDLSGTELRLSGLETAVQRRQQSAAHAPDADGAVARRATAGPGKDVRPPMHLEDMQERLAALRGSDEDWQEKLRQQQAEVQRLEAALLAAGHGAPQHGFEDEQKAPPA
eukprot:TRINITY_DN122228_c0_g1_i1.p1 TRINITY_DN122228_c0_g1~~TRINITY_DN122228_c0_g1_i1.p1  ORF type:complete len:402 (-),score=132.45 TRINITY_DN122228_c0_g1_i1:124-1329(-)